MRLRHLRDAFAGQEIYIVGSGPTAEVFPMDFLADKVCLSLNDSYKIHPAITPVALMHHVTYCREGNTPRAPLHPHFEAIRYPVAKGTGRSRAEAVDWEHPYFYFYDWHHGIERIHELTKDTDHLYYTPEGCSLHAALQLAWILGARTVYTVGCDSMTLAGRHYARYDKNGFRDDEVLKRGQQRNYDSYVRGTLIVQDFLRRKGVRVLHLSPLAGYHRVDWQHAVLRGEVPFESLLEDAA